MLVESVRDSKSLPDYSRSDEHEVFLRLDGEMQDASFVKYLAKLDEEQATPFSSHQYLVLDLVRRNQPIPRDYRPELDQLRSAGIVVVEGRGRGVKNRLNPDSYQPSSTTGDTFTPASRQLQSLLAELHAEKKVHSIGRTKAARWLVGKEPT